jgi:hypothetical protein
LGSPLWVIIEEQDYSGFNMDEWPQRSQRAQRM